MEKIAGTGLNCSTSSIESTVLDVTTEAPTLARNWLFQNCARKVNSEAITGARILKLNWSPNMRIVSRFSVDSLPAFLPSESSQRR